MASPSLGEAEPESVESRGVRSDTDRWAAVSPGRSSPMVMAGPERSPVQSECQGILAGEVELLGTFNKRRSREEEGIGAVCR